MKSRYFGAVAVAVMVLFTLVVWGQLPERLPSHWNARGEVDGWTGKGPGVFLLPAVTLGLWLLFQVLPRIDPRAKNYERFAPTYWTLANVALLFMALLHVLVLGAALGWPIDVSRVMLVALGALFVALGNYLPRIKPNWWMGIRTPWTLDNDQVWRETHRLGGKTFVAAGLITVAVGLLSPQRGFTLMIASLVLAAVVPLVYSYLAWRRERN